MKYYFTKYQSPIADLTIACSDNAIVGLWMEGQKYFGSSILDKMTEKNGLALLDRAKFWLDEYFALKNPKISQLPLKPMGSDFSLAVWKILRQIPYGQVITYNDIAKKITKERNIEKMSARAVGSAVGYNPISIIIPCHRVIGSNGSLCGFSGGIDKKIKLLEHEGVDVSRFFVPKSLHN